MPLLAHDDVPGLPPDERRYLRGARLVRRGGALALAAIVWDGEGERRAIFTLGDAPALQALGEAEAGIVALGSDGEASDEREEMRARCDDGAVVEITNEEGVAEVTLQRAGRRVQVWRARGMAAAPAVAAADGGHWIAWHHDVREDDLRRDVAKWIALRFVDAAGGVFECVAPMLDRDRDLEGEEQSFEFPAVVVGADGAVAIFGRGSHDFYRQDVSAGGWTGRRSLSSGGWGSRGRRCVAAVDGDQVVFVRREKKGLQIEREPAPSGGAPALRDALTDLVPRQTSDVPVDRSFDRSADPATRHGLHTYFGDIQQHSAHSDGVGSAEEAHLRARDRYGDDFVALTDHESFLGKRTGPGEWEYLQRVADGFDAPGRFAALLAYEWTGRRYPGPGHKCVYVPARGTPIVSRDDVPEGRALVQAIKAQGGIASPHHVGWTGCDEDGHDPVGQPVWEICSCHGCYEHADHPLGARGDHDDQLADVMLAKGHRFGFTASSDSHGLLWHHGESRKRDPYRTGLTAVQAPELTREAVLEALRARRCYATSGVKILLDVQVAGAPMGAEIDPADQVPVVVRAVGTSTLARVEVVTRSGTVASEAVDARAVERTLEVPFTEYLYVRVVQADGEMAWSSPVFARA